MWIDTLILSGAVLGLVGLLGAYRAATRTLIEQPSMRPGQRIPHLYKWSRDHAKFVEWQIKYADAHPRCIDGVDYVCSSIHPDCYFKINHELRHHAEDSPSPREDHLELLVESKMVLTRDRLGGEEFYVLRIRPLRGTDFWPVIVKFIEKLGPPDTMVVARDFAGGDLHGPRTAALSTQDIECIWNCWGRPSPMANSKAEQEA